jgi:hypothetical protein
LLLFIKLFTLYLKVLFMSKIKEPIQQLNEIRNLMERSSRFISLSGLSGVIAGAAALTGASIAYFKRDATTMFLISDAVIVLVIAILSSIYLTIRRARQSGQKVWDRSARRLVINMLIPLATGGFFCLILLNHDLIQFLPSATLIFYGLALVNASKYTLPEVRILGIAEIILGLAAGLLMEHGLIFWAAGFGLLHVIYGLVMYNRYEKTE